MTRLQVEAARTTGLTALTSTVASADVMSLSNLYDVWSLPELGKISTIVVSAGILTTGLLRSSVFLVDVEASVSSKDDMDAWRTWDRWKCNDSNRWPKSQDIQDVQGCPEIFRMLKMFRMFRMSRPFKTFRTSRTSRSA